MTNDDSPPPDRDDGTVLHYIFDPLCGWCYAVAPLIEAARKIRDIHIELHPGGMLSGPMRRRITADWREHVIPMDRRIASLSGQHFGEAYFDGLLRNDTIWLDSAPPTAAILAAEALAGQGLQMLHRIQRGHYIEGQAVAEPDVLLGFARDLDLDGPTFEAHFESWAGKRSEVHVAATRQLMNQFGISGFPAVLMHRGGTWGTLPIQRYLGRPALWREVLEMTKA
ncbi:DsbA family protein [Castellaniella caeni]|uniref:DsbA family protein n=1 Tax=Castellaniella caeni TaxID=266123 RepID=UPI0008304EB6|nr:DsbA family protein [Castellaniella caeni]